MTTFLDSNEINTLKDMRSRARDNQIGYWEIYKWLADGLSKKNDSSLTQTILWLRGATEANANRGAFSALIRAYTETQSQLRFGVKPDGLTMQAASNQIAENLMRDLLGESPDWQIALVPDINRIAKADATAVGEALFNQDQQDTSAALKQNSAWSGTLLFSILGSNQTGRLTSTGMTSGLDTLNDLRDVLYACVSYAAGLKAAWGAKLDQPLTDGLIIGASIWGNFIQGPGTYSALWNTVVAGANGSNIKPAFSLIRDIGPNRFLDMVMGAALGSPLIGKTNDANFAANCRAFFGALSPAQLQTIQAELLPADVGGLVAKAKTDVNARAALAALSAVSVTVNSEVAEKLSIYDAGSDSGQVSEKWIMDRAAMLVYLKEKLQLEASGANPFSIVGESSRYFDLASNTDVTVGLLPISQKKYIFGSTGSDSLSGDSEADHLFGGNGDDQLNSGGGADYVEGNGGNDNIDAGEGSDTILGGTGNDFIKGGTGSDVILGGKGVDDLSGGEGHDVIYGGDNADLLYGDGGNDFLNGGAGVDVLSGGLGNDYVFDQGGAVESNTLLGGGGNDLLELSAGSGAGTFDGGAGNDVIIAGTSGESTINGGDDNDVIIGGDAYDIIKGEAGADNIEAGAGGDLITGGAGSDYMRGGSGADDYIFETSAFDTDLISDDSGKLSLSSGAILSGGAYQAKSLAFEGEGYEYRKFQIGNFSALMINAKGDENNTIFIDRWQEGQLGINLSGQDTAPQRPNITPTTVNSRPENNNVDVIRSDGGDGGLGNDILIGTGAQSLLSGGAGNDILDGRDGDDWLEGGADNDLILTGKGKDVVYGGSGDDIVRVGYTLDWANAQLADSNETVITYRAGGGFSPVAGSNTESQFIYYVNGGARTTEHPQLAVFDFKFAPKISQTETYSGKLWWRNVGDTSISAEPSLEVTVTLGDPENVRPGVNLNAEPSSNLGKAVDYKVFLGEVKDVLAPSSGEQGARVWGGDGNDILYGGNDADKLHGDADNDVLVGYDGADELYGDAGTDELSGGNGRDFLDGGTENDTLVGGLGADVLHGASGDDKIIGDAMYLTGTNWYPTGLDETKMGGDLAYGGAGNDQIWGNNGDDYLFGGADNDTISGGADDDHLFGEENDDVLIGGGGDDYVDGGSGADILYDDVDGKNERGQENKSNDIFFGRAGDDELDGGAGDDILDGGDDNDVLTGGDGNDILRGGAGKDRLYGDNGAKAPGMDILEGGGGDDALHGGGGSDMYVFNLGDGKDIIQDDGSNGSNNIVVFKFSASQIRSVTRSGADLVISYGVDDSVTVKGYYGGGFTYGYTAASLAESGNDPEPQAAIAQICFEDGTVWDRARIHELAPPPSEPIADPFSEANLPYFVNTLLSRETVRSAGKHELTYSFAETFSGGEKNAYLFNDAQKAAVRGALAKFSEVIDVTFTEVGSGTASDLRYILDDLTSADSGAFAGYASSQTGEIHLNSGLFSRQYTNEFGELLTKQTLAEGTVGFEVLLHETGHALGLKHPFELPLLPDAENNNSNTVMSYTRTGEPARQLASFDVAALQFLYGVARNTKTGDDTYTFADRYVYDAAGLDTLDASQESAGVFIDLAQGGWSSVGERNTSILAPKQTYIGNGSQIENAIGGSGNDVLSGNAQANMLVGGDGDDRLTGNGGDDVLKGGAGVDTYRFNKDDGTDIIIDTDGLSRIELNGVTAEQVYWHNGYLYHGTEGARIAIEVSQIGELVIGNVSYVGQAIADVVRIILGTVGSDSLVGSNDADRMSGIDGDDTLSGLGGKDSVYGGLGSDVLRGGAGDDLLDGGAGSDALYGDDDNDIILGGAGSDALYGGAANDQLDGGADNDALYGDAGDDVLVGGSGDDSLSGGIGADVLDGGAGNDTLYGGTGAAAGGGDDIFRFSRGSGQDTIYESVSDIDQDKIQMVGLSEQNLAFGIVGNDLVISIIGSEDRLTVSRFFESNARTIETIELAGGVSLSKSDVFSRVLTNYVGGAGNDNLVGRSLNNRLEGNEGNDTLTGGSGYNLFIGGRGNDRMLGGASKDTYVFNAGDGRDSLRDGVDSTAGNDADQIVFGEGLTRSDIVFIPRADLPTDDPDYAPSQWLDLVVRVRNTTDRMIIENFFTYGQIERFTFSNGDQLTSSDVLELVKRTVGSDTADFLRGGDSADTSLAGLAGNDTVFGFGGNDWIDGGDGNDTLLGGEGDDQLLGGRGQDWIYAGNGNDTLRGGDNGDTLLGEFGDDWIDGGEGDDELRGSDGDDQLLGGSGRDVLYADNGNDTLRGGDDNDLMYGSQGADLLEGGAGNDTLWGADSLSGAGDGANTLMGGAGNDAYIGGDGDDVFVFGRGDGSDTISSLTTGGLDTLRFGFGVLPEQVQLYRDGTDLVAVIDGSSTQTRIKSFYASSSLPVEQMAFESGVIWSTAEILSRTIAGQVDQLVGTSGNDVFIVDNVLDTVSEAAAGGVDEIRTSVSYVLPSNVENVTATGVLNLTIQGNSADNVLTGNASDNEFRGGGGTDRALGGLGDDTYYIESTGVLNVEEKVGEGIDTLVQGYGDWTAGNWWENNRYRVTLSENVENLILGRSSATMLNGSYETYARGGYGNSQDNLIKGESDNENELDGFGGRDTLIGGSRADVFRVDREDDVIIDLNVYDGGRNVSVRTFENSQVIFAGGDLVESTAASYTLGANLEHLRLVGSTALTGIGNALNNAIVGNQYANRIDGGAGDDRLFDAQTQAGSWGSVAPPSQYAYDNDTLIGGDGNDQITAYNGDDYLDGGAGDDLITAAGGLATLIGGTGNDTLTGSGLGTVYRYAQGDGNDTIRVTDSFRSASPAAGRDRLVFGAGILSEQVTMARTGGDSADLLLSLANGGSVLLDDYFYVTQPSGYRSRALERIEFSNGTIWSRNDVDRYFGLPTDPEGTDSSDALMGNSLSNVLRGLGGNDTLSGEGGDDYLYGGDGDDVLIGGQGWDYMEGGQGNDVYRDADGSMVIVEAEGGGIDVLEVSTEGSMRTNVEIGIVTSATGGAIYGGLQAETLIGNLGADTLIGNEGNDELRGGAGADSLNGGTGNDIFVFNKGDGQDVIQAYDAQSATDTIRIGALDSEVIASRSGNLLLLKVRNSVDQISVIDYFAAATTVNGVSWDNKVDRIEFSNGSVWDKTMIQTAVNRALNNRTPTVSGSIPALVARQDSLFSYAVPVGTITDPDSWDSITYSVKMSDGSSVPAWLNFDPVTRVLSGTPAATNLGSVQFVLWGTDNYGAAVGTSVSLSVNPPNKAPVVSSALPDQSAYEGAVFSYAVASAAFTDPDAGDTLSYAAALADGAALPGWLSFNASTRAFTGTPPDGSTGKVSVRVTARDTGNLTVSDVFDITISIANLTKTGTASAETLTGGSGNDTLSGAGGNDTLEGRAGDDLLDGGTGNDSLIGGLGNDLYVVDSSTDVILESVGEGTDSVQSSVTYTLSANVENLTLTGTTAINGTGNAGNNLLIGNSAVNSLSGGVGNDTLDGGAGADSLIGGLGRVCINRSDMCLAPT